LFKTNLPTPPASLLREPSGLPVGKELLIALVDLSRFGRRRNNGALFVSKGTSAHEWFLA
jgi:hypothetical protein